MSDDGRSIPFPTTPFRPSVHLGQTAEEWRKAATDYEEIVGKFYHKPGTETLLILAGMLRLMADMREQLDALKN